MNGEASEDPLDGPCSALDLRDSAFDEKDEELAALAKAVAHPVRLQILRLLGARSACVCGEIVDMLPLAQSTVSEHLRILKAAGLVKGEVEGPRVCYCLDPQGIARLKKLVEDL